MALKVLIVQPESIAGQTLLRYFTERGDELRQAADPALAAGLLEGFQPDLMVLDQHFPGGEWMIFLRTFRLRFPDAKIILTNKFPDLQREIMASEVGVSVFLRQPFTQRWIDSALQRAFAKPTNGHTPEKNRQKLPRVRVPVRIKITLPYLVLALLFALVSAYFISQIVLESAQDRYLNQLISTGRQSADWMVREENRLLSTLRLITNSQGVADAIQAQDSETLRTLTFPLAVNAHEENVEILDVQGLSLLSMRLNPGGNAADFSFGRGDTVFQQQAFVRQTILAKPDSLGDKYAGVVLAPWGKVFYVCGPVYDANGQAIGVVMVGKTLQTLVRQSSQETLALTTLYDPGGQPLASVLFKDDQVVPVDTEQTAQVMASQDKSSVTRNLTTTGIDYTEVLGPWEARSGMDLGVVGTALTHSFLVRTSSVTQVEVFVVVALGIVMVISVGLFLSGRISRPLVKLALASAEVAQGNLEIKVDSQGNDEVAVLAHAFNYMVAGLQEGSVYRDLLGRTVSPEVRDQLRQTFSSGNIRLEGQQAIATVLMTDIRGFTSLSEHSDPAAVLNWLNEYFSRIVPIVTAKGGVVNKFDGDAMLAFFGILPRQLSPQLGAKMACQAAIEIQKTIDELNAQRVERNEPLFVTGVGINTGVVIAGGLGSSDRLHYTIIGDTVNTAQRLETLTRQIYAKNGILISQATFNALGEMAEEFRLELAGNFMVKGKSEQLQVYRLLPQQERLTEVLL